MMKAIVWQGEQRYAVRDVPMPTLGPGQVLVKVEAASVCGSDFHLADFGSVPPLIPGHEAAGTVSHIGEGVTTHAVGDRVALNPVQWCGSCWFCTHAMEHLCTDFRHLGVLGVPGTWAQYVAVDARNAHHLPAPVDFVAGSLLEPAAVCYQSFERAGMEAGQSVLIIGDGPFGFLHAQMAVARSAGIVLVAGHHDARLKRIAARTGAVICNTRDADLHALVARHVGAPGVDLVIEATGSGDAPNIAVRALRPRGTLVLFSAIWKPQPLDMARVHINEINLVGSCRSLRGFEPCLRLMAKGMIDTACLVDVTAPLARYDEVLERVRTDRTSLFKAVFLAWSDPVH